MKRKRNRLHYTHITTREAQTLVRCIKTLAQQLAGVKRRLNKVEVRERGECGHEAGG